jgi:hypothetical protein
MLTSAPEKKMKNDREGFGLVDPESQEQAWDEEPLRTHAAVAGRSILPAKA